MTTMSETGSDSTRPQGRVALLRRHGGYAICVVVDEGPYPHDEAVRRAAKLSPSEPRPGGTVTKREAADILGITVKGVEYLRAQGLLTQVGRHKGKVLLALSSVNEHLDRRNATG